MAIFSPLTIKRFKAFRRIRRSWWSLIALSAIFAFTLMADWVSPYDPRAVIDPATLEKYRESEIENVYEIKTARFNLTDAGNIEEWEGPLPLKAELTCAIAAGGKVEKSGYETSSVRRDGYVRYFLKPLSPPAVTSRKLPPKEISFPFRPCREHPFGIDAGGRDVLSRVIHGMRIALVFALALALSGMFFGVVVGSLQGYFGGRTDIALQRFTEVWSALPFLYVMIFVGSTLGRSFTLLLICYALFNWITVSYYMRAEFLRLRKRTFVEAARMQGFSAMRVIFVHILPNALTPLITLFPFLLMGAIGSLAALDFLGFGLPPMTPSCGELLNQAQQFRHAWWLTLFPSLALFTVMLLSVFIGEGLRDAFDPRQKTRLE
jgi:ABC-type microcin C transport system permease subunit YejE